MNGYWINNASYAYSKQRLIYMIHVWFLFFILFTCIPIAIDFSSVCASYNGSWWLSLSFQHSSKYLIHKMLILCVYCPFKSVLLPVFPASCPPVSCLPVLTSLQSSPGVGLQLSELQKACASLDLRRVAPSFLTHGPEPGEISEYLEQLRNLAHCYRQSHSRSSSDEDDDDDDEY